MKAFVLAAGYGTRLHPVTANERMPKPLVPILGQPVMGRMLDLLRLHGIADMIANVSYGAQAIKDRFADQISYSDETEPLGTAGGVRNGRWFLGDEPFLVVSSDALTGINFGALIERHHESGGLVTIAATTVSDTSQYGVIVTDAAGRITDFQEKPKPEEARSQLANAGIYVVDPRVFELFPDTEFVDWAKDVFPRMLTAEAPFHVHEFDEYWNDIGSLDELRAGVFAALDGRVQIESKPGLTAGAGFRYGASSRVPLDTASSGSVWIGEGVTIGRGVRLTGPVVIEDGARIGHHATIRDALVLPRAIVPANHYVTGIYGAS